MSQIEEGKHVYHIYTFVLNADVSTEVILVCRLWMIIYSWSRTRHCWRDFVSKLSDFKYFFDDCQIMFWTWKRYAISWLHCNFAALDGCDLRIAKSAFENCTIEFAL